VVHLLFDTTQPVDEHSAGTAIDISDEALRSNLKNIEESFIVLLESSRNPDPSSCWLQNWLGSILHRL
jgi:hypothetical protein